MENKNKQVQQEARSTPQEKTTEIKLMREQLSKSGEVRLLIGIGVIGFLFGIGADLGTKMVNSLEELISRREGYCQ